MAESTALFKRKIRKLSKSVAKQKNICYYNVHAMEKQVLNNKTFYKALIEARRLRVLLVKNRNEGRKGRFAEVV
ncbi:MAG: hypothetical protein E7256_09510 [Lachnospiraceae bacterium]|nr:hypothetical protein [Lachnospiraceae bacterium]